MSYILDALKRADAERGRGAVPGLHARQITHPPAQDAHGTRNRAWLAGAAALALGSIAAGLWLWQTPDGDARLAVVQPAAQARPAGSSAPTAAPPAVPATPKAKPSPLPLARASAAQAAAVAIPLLSELSEEIRREIPPLTITGTVYSANPEQRLLLINGQVLTQGSLVAPDVNLEEIRARSSVFSFRGTRFRVAQ